MNTKVLQICLILLVTVFGCDRSGGQSVKPVSERIKRVYTAQEVLHDGVLVYSAGKTSNTFPEYSSYRLDLSVAGKVSLRDITSDTFTGVSSVTASSLILSDLSPQPTGSSGTITYQIKSISDDGKSLILVGTKGSPKTGNTINVYTLIGS